MERSGGRENEVECFREMIQQISSYHYIVSTDLIGKLSFFTLPSTQTHMNSLSIAQGEQRYWKLAQEEREEKRENRGITVWFNFLKHLFGIFGFVGNGMAHIEKRGRFCSSLLNSSIIHTFQHG